MKEQALLKNLHPHHRSQVQNPGVKNPGGFDVA